MVSVQFFCGEISQRAPQNDAILVSNNIVRLFLNEKTSTCYLFAMSPHPGTMVTRLPPRGSLGCLGAAAFNGCGGPFSHLLRPTVLLSRAALSFFFYTLRWQQRHTAKRIRLVVAITRSACSSESQAFTGDTDITSLCTSSMRNMDIRAQRNFIHDVPAWELLTSNGLFVLAPYC